jgi:hypothetical protein
MIYKVNTQDLISNQTEVAQRILEHHKQNGERSNLSIFEVARLMDQVVFKANNESASGNYFEFCFN